MKFNSIKFLIIFIFAFPIVFFIHIGFLLDSFVKILQTLIFTICLSGLIVWPFIRKYMLLVSSLLIIAMAVLSSIDMIEVADIIGSTGVGLIIINLFSYLPQLVKLGYIKQL